MVRILTIFTIITGLLAFASPGLAGVETSYVHHKDRITTPWYASSTPETRQADLQFITGMHPHHAGALSMSKEYLSDPGAQNARLQQLAKGIIHNQQFEMAVMDMIKAHQNKNAKTPDTGLQIVGEKDMVQKLVFWRKPMPGPLDRLYGDQNVSKRDVQFAKAMIIHHEGALVMAQNYLDGPANNGYLQRLNLDILVDQAQEIAYMHSIIDEYPGDPNDVEIDASMIHGMEGMAHMLPGHGGMHHGANHH